MIGLENIVIKDFVNRCIICVEYRLILVKDVWC